MARAEQPLESIKGVSAASGKHRYAGCVPHRYMARVKVVGIGDSTTAGTPGFLSPLEAPPVGRGDPESQYSYWVARADPKWDVLNRGVNGQTSGQMLARFQADVVDEAPAVVVVLGGVNDIYGGAGPASVERNLEAMYALAGRNKIVAIGATILPYNTSGRRERAAIRAVNAWVEASCRGTRLFCDTNAAVADPGDPDRLASSPDGLHPDPQGYRKMGEAVAATLERAWF